MPSQPLEILMLSVPARGIGRRASYESGESIDYIRERERERERGREGLVGKGLSDL